MKRVAIFVEGQTESIFTQELVRQILGGQRIVIKTQMFAGKGNARKITQIYSPAEDETAKYFFLICNSRQDSQVRSDIMRQIPHLQEKNYSLIIGLRDSYPEKNSTELRKRLNHGLDTLGIPINIILAIQEIEAWFIAEENHYSKISPALTVENVNKIAKLDVTTDSTEMLEHPSALLNQIYGSVDASYSKKKYEVENIVYNLDYDNLYFNVRKRNTSFNELVSCLDKIVVEEKQ